MSSLPEKCLIRRATAKDIWAIRKLVFSAMLDPTQIKWQQFWLIECDRAIVACGQLRDFNEVQELGSLVVRKDWRNQGLGTLLTNYLIKEADRPLYLECLGKKLKQFYIRFGFVPVSWQELPQNLKFKFGITLLGKNVLKIPVTVMHHQK
ncbi:MAG: GNAT family N-acetyltransferase [Prochloraceae cyanobacterium]